MKIYSSRHALYLSRVTAVKTKKSKLFFLSKFRPIRAYSYFSISLVALILFPFMNRKSDQTDLRSGNIPGDSFYSARIFAAQQDLFGLGDFYIDSENFALRRGELLDIPIMTLRLIFKYIITNHLAHYQITSYLVLVLWISLAFQLVSIQKQNNSILSMLIVGVALVFFFGNNNLVRNYEFARPVSPQLTGLLWLLFLYVSKKYFENLNDIRKRQNLSFMLICLVIVSIYSSVFLFLVLGSTFGVFLVSTLVQGIWKIGFKTLLGTSFAVVSSVVGLYSRESNAGLADASERLGLIETRLPGAFNTVAVSLLTAFMILVRQYFKVEHTPLSHSERVLLMASIGVVLASQSNVLTKTDIQFSYHFEQFSYLNLCLALSHYFLIYTGKLRSFRLKIELGYVPKVRISLIFVAVIGQVLFFLSAYTAPRISELKIRNVDIVKIENAIIDDARVSTTLPILSDFKILYNEHMFYYGYSDAELLKRAYVSMGCPSTFTTMDVQSAFVYKIDAPLLKAKRYRELMATFPTFRLFEGPVEDLEREGLIARREIQSDLDSVLRQVLNSDCISLAKEFEVELVLFNGKSHWYKILEDSGLQINETSIIGLFSAKL